MDLESMRGGIAAAIQHSRQSTSIVFTPGDRTGSRGVDRFRSSTKELFGDIGMLTRDTGMRNEMELYRVGIENIDWDRHVVFVADSKTVTGIREVPLSDRVFEILRRRYGDRRAGGFSPPNEPNRDT